MAWYQNISNIWSMFGPFFPSHRVLDSTAGNESQSWSSFGPKSIRLLGPKTRVILEALPSSMGLLSGKPLHIAIRLWFQSPCFFNRKTHEVSMTIFNGHVSHYQIWVPQQMSGPSARVLGARPGNGPMIGWNGWWFKCYTEPLWNMVLNLISICSIWFKYGSICFNMSICEL